MTKTHHAAAPAPVVIDRSVYELPFLLEGPDGAPPTEGPIVVQWHERKFTCDGVHYEHVATGVDDRWIYRPMP